MTYTEQLAEVNTAITRILTAGQQIGRSGAYAQHALYRDLVAERKRLEPLAAAEATGTSTPVWRTAQSERSR